MMGFVIGFASSFLVSLLFACIPLYRWWQKERKRKMYNELTMALLLQRDRIEKEHAEQAKHEDDHVNDDHVNADAREDFADKVDKLSREIFGEPEPGELVKKPPVPDDPVCRAICGLVKQQGRQVMIPCGICGDLSEPDDNACCEKCGLFCLFWAVQFKEAVSTKAKPKAKRRPRGKKRNQSGK